MAKVISIVLGGGQGTRLRPLTNDRAKPAVPVGGKYRLVDIPLSNCINSGFKQIYVLTQFNSASLHRHISSTYRFDAFSKGFVEILAAEQRVDEKSWYEGTADAVRKNLKRFEESHPDCYMILSGDQLYNMDLRDFLRKHMDSEADVSIASIPVDRNAATELGILQIDKGHKITSFVEKPDPHKDISAFKISEGLPGKNGKKEYLASMGIYIFNASTMKEVLQSKHHDFGKAIIPKIIVEKHAFAYLYEGYWEDIGKISDFFESTLKLAVPFPQFNLYDEEKPIYTKRIDLPPSKINAGTIKNSITAEGSIISDAQISHSVIGIRTIINSFVKLEEVYSMGADRYETIEEKRSNDKNKIPNIGIGEGTEIKRAIIDKDVRIGKRCRIGVDAIDRKEGDYGNYHIVDGIIVISKGKILPDGTVI